MALKLKKMPSWPVWALLCLAPQAHAAQVPRVEVSREGGLFLIGMRLRVDAPPPAVFRALQDYSALPLYAPDVRTVHLVRTATPHRVLLFTTLHACVLFFCKTMYQEQVMTAVADANGGVLTSVLLPQGSDFKKGLGRWTVRPCRAHEAPTCVDVRIEMQPAFWVPPLIGPWLIRRKMLEQASRASVGLERIARRDERARAKAQSTRSSSSKQLINKPNLCRRHRPGDARGCTSHDRPGSRSPGTVRFSIGSTRKRIQATSRG